MDYKQRSREEILNDAADSMKLPTIQEQSNILQVLILTTLLDCRDALNLLTEQSKKQRVEKVKVCGTCGGTGEVTEYNDVMLADDAPKILPFKVRCPDCGYIPQQN